MSRRQHRLWLLPWLFLAGQAWALGLGDIRLDSSLNQPLRAEIGLLAATPEELNNLSVQLASAETFARYDLERPLYLTRIDFQLVRSGRADGNFVRVTSREPMTEPFVTFLVEANWSRGRLLREYTVLLDPPTFAPPPVTQSTQAVTAPTRTESADSGQIQRTEPQPAPQTAPAPQTVSPPVERTTQDPAPTIAAPPAVEPAGAGIDDGIDGPDFATASGGEVVVVRGDTLWGISNRVRPDSRLTINQTMLAIYEANPQAFAGNINRLRSGARLRIPSADDVFRISRGDAFAEVKRQNDSWGGTADQPAGAPTVLEPAVEPSLTLVPPDEEEVSQNDASIDLSPESLADDAVDEVADSVVVDPTEQRISEIEALIEDQDALIEIPDSELAALRAELAELRGEEIPAADIDADGPGDALDDQGDEIFVDDDVVVDETGADDAAVDGAIVEEPVVEPAPAVVSSSQSQSDGILGTVLGYLSNFWVLIGVGLAAAVGLLLWFMRRSSGDADLEGGGMWEALGDEELDSDATSGTQRFPGPGHQDDTTILVEEQTRPEFDSSETAEVSIAGLGAASDATDFSQASADPLAATGTSQALDDTFSSETSINLDQGDPISDADFHMAYGLYDQAADLVNGALASDPENKELLAKLCEIYFVWGNREAFVDAAGRMQEIAGGGDDPEWDKIVIMGQQIAGDDALFTGVSAGAASKAVDVSFDSGDDTAAELDMDFAMDGADESDDVIDLGSDSGEAAVLAEQSGVDFNFGDDDPIEVSATREMPDAATNASNDGDEIDDFVADDVADESTARTVETPTIEQQFASLDVTGELPSLDDQEDLLPAADATAEIDLDDLGLDLDAVADTTLAADIDEVVGLDDLEDTAENKGIDLDELAATGRNPAIDPDATGIQEGVDAAAITGISELSGEEETMLASLDDDDDHGGTDIVDLDASLLDATGMTQIISEKMAVDTAADIGASLADDEKTMLAPLDNDAEDEKSDFDFAQTEALPKDVFSSDMSTDDTGRIPTIAGSTDMDLDLDDLTAALKVSEVGDTVNQVRDEKTVEQPRLRAGGVDLDVGASLDDFGGGEGATTQALAPDEISEDLHDARTMTEVGTKLDLARAYVDMGDPGGARSILEEVLSEGDEGQKQQAKQLMDTLPAA